MPDYSALVTRILRIADLLTHRPADVANAISSLRGEGGGRDPVWMESNERNATFVRIANDLALSSKDLSLLLSIVNRDAT